MKTSLARRILISLALLAAGSAGRAQSPSTLPPSPAPAVVRPTGVPPALLDEKFLYQVVRYLYRYQLDESEIDHLATRDQLVFWVRRLQPPREDPDDRSEFGEVMLPQVGYSVRLKRSDYRIEELGVEIKSRGFKIYNVTDGELPAVPPAEAEVVHVDAETLKDYLFQSRFQRDFPAPVLLERLRTVASAEVQKAGMRRGNLEAGQHGENIVHVGPLSPVSNEIWCFWESGRRLYRFTSDIDLENPSVWERENLKVDLYDLDQQVVISHEEAPGSNRFLTRYEVGRALYNCIVIGQRLEITAEGIKEKPLGDVVNQPAYRPGKKLPDTSRSVAK